MLLNSTVTKDRIVDSHTSQIVIEGVVLVDKCIGNVRHIESAVAFTSQVHFPALHIKCIHEISVKADKLLGEFHLVGNVRHALCESDAHGLFYPNHVGQVHPCVRILNGCLSASLPCEWSIFGEETAQGTTPWAAVEPYGNFILCSSIARRKEPEEEFASFVGSL